MTCRVAVGSLAADLFAAWATTAAAQGSSLRPADSRCLSLDILNAKAGQRTGWLPVGTLVQKKPDHKPRVVELFAA